jgi:hypothetical protein
MLHLMDYQALRLDPEARSIRRATSIRKRRPGVLRRRMGEWLVNTGARLAQDEPHALRTVAGCT